MDVAILDHGCTANTDVDWENQDVPKTLYALLERSARMYPDHKATSFQLTSGPGDKAETLTYAQLLARVCQAANMFRAHGIGETDFDRVTEQGQAGSRRVLRVEIPGPVRKTLGVEKMVVIVLAWLIGVAVGHVSLHRLFCHHHEPRAAGVQQGAIASVCAM